MAILYTQFLSLPDYKIIRDAYSLQGSTIQSHTFLLKNLRTVIQNIPDKSLHKSYEYTHKDFRFFVKVSDKIIAIITDLTTNSEVAEMYMCSINPQEDLKKASDKFNSKHDYYEADIELKQTKSACVESLNQIVQRGEMIDKLGDLADKLREASYGLNKQSRNMYYKEMINQYFVWLVIVAIIFVIFYLFFKF